MRKAIDRRLAAAEEAANARAVKLQMIRVEGGLPGSTRCATVDGVHWQRLPEETVEQFEQRLLAAANKAKAKVLVIGSPLCGCAWRTPDDFEEHLAGFRPHDDGEDDEQAREPQVDR